MEERTSILIVDDNVSLCRAMSLFLKRKGYTVATASDGIQALERVKESPFDVILMDVKMPLADGVETYRKITKIRPQAVVVMMSAYAVEDVVQQVLEEGARGIIYKPPDIERLVALIEEVREAK